MALVQITMVHAGAARLPRGQRPVFELELEDNAEVVGVHNYWTTDRESRETVDYHANFWVATRLGRDA